MIEMFSPPVTQAIQKAADFLRKGKLVAFPTETVYGLGADAANPEAVAKIFSAKGRPADHPLIVHLGDISQLKNWVKEINSDALLLAQHFWPGALTLILQKADDVLDVVTGGQDTIGIRIPGHPIAQALLKNFGGGIAAPSANRFGHVSATQAIHVREEFGDAVDFILEGGDCAIGIESTIVAANTKELKILRPGAITGKQISEVLGYSIPLISSEDKKIRVSGNLESHYAPNTPLKIISREKLQGAIEAFISEKKSLVVISRQSSLLSHPLLDWVIMPKDNKNYAHDLYAKLREVDEQNYAVILVEELPEEENWIALRDRLDKAKSRLG
jgi:L-threonylcarbamoyladenylate synthase